MSAPMSDDEFNALLNDLLTGRPSTLVMTRLCLTLRDVMDAGGDASRAALRLAVQRYRARDATNEWSEPPPPPAGPPTPRRR